MTFKPIYLDYASTTPVDPRVAAKMLEFMTMDGEFGNPASVTHVYGKRARKAVEAARQQVADLIHADPQEIIWTSGATESDNLALIGAANFYAYKGKHIITTQFEHKAVLDTCKFLRDKQGFEITFLKPDTDGLIAPQTLLDAIRNDTILVSIMHVNNETGVMQDIQSLAQLCKQRDIIFHSDCAQSVGKIPVNMQEIPVDLASISGHKLYGPKGIGVLYVRSKPKVRLQPLIYGGGHEQGLRSGTLATHQIVGMGEACAIAQETLTEEMDKLTEFRDVLIHAFKNLPDVTLNGHPTSRSPGIINVTVAGVTSEALLMTLYELAISAGSACNSASVDPSHVLVSMGLSQQMADSSLRISLGRFTTAEDIAKACALIAERIPKLRALSAQWDDN